METTFTCPHCGAASEIDATFAGQSGPCRICGQQLAIPSPKPLLKSESSRGVLGSWSDLRHALLTIALVFLFLGGLGVLCCVFVVFAVDYGKFKARQSTSANHLKQIALAMHAYLDEHGRLPRAYWLSPQGERTLSWRVAILPYIEQKELFDRIQVGQPWDSSANKELLNHRPSIFNIPAGQNDKNFSPSDRSTSYMVITGPGTLFPDGSAMRLATCMDGPANTILAVEVVDSGVHWAEPKDLDIRTMIMKINGDRAKAISSPWPGGAYVAFADGSVQFLSNKTLEANLRAMITCNGNELVNPDGVTPPKVLTGQ